MNIMNSRDIDLFDQPYNYPIVPIKHAEPIFSVTIGQGLGKIIRPGYVEFTEDIICQKITIRAINHNLCDFLFELQCLDDNKVVCIHSGDMITIRRTTWFRESRYRLLATGQDSDEYVIANFNISWPSRIIGTNSRSDFMSLVAIQSDSEISLPKRTFWSLWNRIGTGINTELEDYRLTGKLGPLRKDLECPGLFRGIRSIFENGSDEQLMAVVYYLTGSILADPKKFRFFGQKMTERINLTDLMCDIGILQGYEYQVTDDILLYFR